MPDQVTVTMFMYVGILPGDMTDEHGDLQGVQVQNPLAIDPSGVQYQFRANTGQGELYKFIPCPQRRLLLLPMNGLLTKVLLYSS